MFDTIVEKLFFEEPQESYRLFVAAPLSFREDKEYRKIIDYAIKAFEEKNNLSVKDYFNTFVLREKKPKVNNCFKKIEDFLDKYKEQSNIATSLRNFYEKEWWINACYSAAKKSDTLLYILPMPVSVGNTLTQGALCESEMTLNNGTPVTVFSYSRGTADSLIEYFELFEITSINDIFEKYSTSENSLRAPQKWFKRVPDMGIDLKWR